LPDLKPPYTQGVAATEQTLEESGVTLEELVARTGHPRDSIRDALSSEQTRGRVRRDGDRYLLVPGALPPELVSALGRVEL
jgi:DNA-binding IclR family transcriptional regulator